MAKPQILVGTDQNPTGCLDANGNFISINAGGPGGNWCRSFVQGSSHRNPKTPHKVTGTSQMSYKNTTGDSASVLPEQEMVAHVSYHYADGGLKLRDMKLNFDVVPVIVAVTAGYFSYLKYKEKKYNWAYGLGGAALGLIGGAALSKGLYMISNK